MYSRSGSPSTGDSLEPILSKVKAVTLHLLACCQCGVSTSRELVDLVSVLRTLTSSFVVTPLRCVQRRWVQRRCTQPRNTGIIPARVLRSCRSLAADRSTAARRSIRPSDCGCTCQAPSCTSRSCRMARALFASSVASRRRKLLHAQISTVSELRVVMASACPKLAAAASKPLRVDGPENVDNRTKADSNNLFWLSIALRLTGSTWSSALVIHSKLVAMIFTTARP